MPARTRALAHQKGFTLVAGPKSGEYRLIDDGTHLPEFNPTNGTFLFSLADARTFLEPLHDRAFDLK
jgi:hypothetical protein